MFTEATIEVRTRTERDGRPPIHTAESISVGPATLHLLDTLHLLRDDQVERVERIVARDVMELLRRAGDCVAQDKSVEDLASAPVPRERAD
jgi:hypothetical protein